MKPTRVGIVGCGKIAQAEHLPGWQAAVDAGTCELVGLCDLDRGLAEALGKSYSAPVYAGIEALIESAAPEVLDITTAVVAHHELVLLALDAGCHVLCEKPVANDAEEAQAMVDAAERADRRLSICFQYRHWDESAYLRDRIAAGDLGHVHSVRTWAGASYNFPYHRRRIQHRGVLSHWAIHNLDLALCLLGHPQPLTATAFCHPRLRDYPAALGLPAGQLDPAGVEPSIEDFAIGMIRLEGDTVITLETSWLQPPSERPEGWEFLGSHGAASMWPIGVMLDRDGQWRDDTPPEGTLEPCSYRMDRLMAAFLESVRTGGPAPVSPEEIITIQRLMDALYLSADTGREVALG